MGIRLASFVGGLAKGLSKKIEEDEKMTQLAMAGRIKEASQITKLRKQEISELKDKMTGMLGDMTQLGITDETVQKAFLSSPSSWETFKKQVTDGKFKADEADKYFTINRDQLGDSTPKEYLDTILAKSLLTEAEAKPEFQDLGGLAPSKSKQERMLAMLAGAEGMTPEQVAAAEAAPTDLYRPTPAMMMKPDALYEEPKRVLRDPEKEAKDLRARMAAGEFEGEELAKVEDQIKNFELQVVLQKAATKDPNSEDKQLTYSKMATRIDDFVNERMRQNLGASWNEYVTYETVDFGGVSYTTSKKVNMPVEEQQKMMAEEQRLRREALSALGLVDQNGAPKYSEVDQYIKANIYTAPPQPAASARPEGVGPDWKLEEDDQGNKAWVSPDRTQFVEVQ